MTTATKQQPLMTAKQVDEKLCVSERTVHRMSMRQDFPQRIKLVGAVRFDAKEVEAWIDARSRGVKYKRPIAGSKK